MNMRVSEKVCSLHFTPCFEVCSEAWWLHGKCAALQIEQVCEAGTLSRGILFCLGKSITGCNSHSTCRSLQPGVQMGTSDFYDGGNPAMDEHPNQEKGKGLKYF